MANFSALPEGTELVGDYRIGRVLGAGGFGVTYLAEEIALARKVTIKEYFPSDFAARSNGFEAVPRSENCRSDYQWGLDRFIEEAQTLARFDHPNICRVYRYFRANNTGYMVLHFEEGQSLKGWLKGLGRAPRQKELDAILPALLDALELIHKADFLHRDIAPDNIMMRKSGVPVLIDFGSARGEIAAHSKTVSALVKPGYSPYEQYAERSSQQGPWTDIYALGATLYHAVTGRRPPDSPSRMVKDEMMPAREAAISAYRASFLRAIDRALALAIEARPQSIAAWRGDLLAPEPVAPKGAKAGGGWLRGGRDKAAGDDDAAGEPLVVPGAPRAVDAVMPPPPDAPGPHGGLLDFVDGLRRQNAPAAAAGAATAVMPAPGPAPAAAAKAAPAPGARAAAAAAAIAPAGAGAATAKLDDGPPPAPSFFRRRKDDKPAAAGAEPAAPLAQAARAAADASAKAGSGDAVSDSDAKPPKGSAKRAAGKAQKATQLAEPPAVKAAAAATEVQAQPVNLPVAVTEKAPERKRPARQKAKAREPSRLRPLLMKLAIGAGIASLAVSLQNRLPQPPADPKSTAAVAGRKDGASASHGIAAQPVLATELKGHQGAVQAIAVSDDGQLIVSAGTDATLKVWNAATSRLVRSIPLADGAATALSLAGHRALTGHADGRVVLWDLDRAEKLQTFRRNEAAIWSVAFLGSPDRFAASSHDWKVAIWDAGTPQAPAHVLEGHDSAVQALAYAPRSGQLASGGADRTVKLWSLETLDLVRTYKGQKDFVTALAFSGDGKTLAAASLDGAVRLMPSGSSRHNRTLTGHSGRVGAVAFAPGDTARLASASEDGSVRLWDARQGRTQRTLTGLGGPVRSLAFLPDGNRLATAGDDGIVRVWTLAPARSE